jgi:hypothetical protein
VFAYRLSFSEVGLTDYLVFNLVQHSQINGQADIEVYKTTWKVESIYGNDIDLFVQNNLGKYNWYALQAKVMSFNSAYTDLKYDATKIKQQWDKLLEHELIWGSKTYYLLYSGLPLLRQPTSAPIRTDCIGIPPIEELGLGIVETGTIKNLRENVLTQYGLLYFNHLFPDHIDSLRKLICCSNSLPATAKQFKKEEIDVSSYERIYLNNNDREDLFESEQISLKEGFAPIRLIISSKG